MISYLPRPLPEMVEDFNQMLGKAVSGWRKGAGMSQASLADALGTQQATVSKLEHGSYKISVSQLSGILGACGLSFRDVAADLDAINTHESQPLWERVYE